MTKTTHREEFFFSTFTTQRRCGMQGTRRILSRGRRHILRKKLISAPDFVDEPCSCSMEMKGQPMIRRKIGVDG